MTTATPALPREFAMPTPQAFRSPDATRRAYERCEVIGAALDLDFLPWDVRRYARYQRDETRDYLGRQSYRFEQVAPGNLYQDYQGQLCVAYQPYMKHDPTKAYWGRQLTGDCVSWSKRTMQDQARCFEIDVYQELEEYVCRAATALGYSFRGHTGQGASPSRVARAIVEHGILLEQVYDAPDGSTWDFRDYDRYYKIGVKYGRTGLPDWLLEITRKHRPRNLAEVSTEEELLTALWNGCGVGVGSGIGVSDRGGKDGVSFLSGLKGSWPHDMAIIGFDDRKKYHKQTLIIWDQSWGEWNDISGWPPEYGPRPQGAFVLTLSDTMRAVRGGECHAMSDTEGFRPRRLPDYGATGRV